MLVIISSSFVMVRVQMTDKACLGEDDTTVGTTTCTADFASLSLLTQFKVISMLHTVPTTFSIIIM